MGSQKNYLGHSGLFSSFVTVFKTILKLVEFLQVVGNQLDYLGNSGRTLLFVTVFKTFLELVEFFTSCGQLEKIFRTLEKVHKLCSCIQNYC